MDFRGIFEHGVIRPTEPIALPEGTEVECHPIASTNGVEPTPQVDGFWISKSIDQLAREQRTRPVNSIADLRTDWPASDSIDDFLEFIDKGRQ